MRFRATLELTGKTACGFRVPPEVVEALASSKRPPVLVTIGDHTYRSTIAPMGGDFWLGVSAENRAAAGVAAGQELDVEIELDTQARTVALPEDFAAALEADADARHFFDGLSYSLQRWHVLSVEGAKTAETRQRRIEKSLSLFREGRAR